MPVLAFATIPLKSTACWFVTNVACLPHTTNLLICHTRNLEQQQNLESLSSISRASGYFYCSDLRSGIDLRLRILRRRWVRSHAGEQSLYGSCQLLLSPSQTHPVPEVPEAILPVWWTQYQNRSTRSNFLPYCQQCTVCSLYSRIPLE